MTPEEKMARNRRRRLGRLVLGLYGVGLLALIEYGLIASGHPWWGLPAFLLLGGLLVWAVCEADL
jgi:fatty acid desaturase